jgi:hypothetical protein
VRTLLTTLVAAALAAGCATHTSPAQVSTAGGGIAEASVRGHMEFLASDAMNGRGSGTRDEWITATYIASHLRRWGLEPLNESGYVQEVRIERSELATPPVLGFEGRRLTHGTEMTVTSLSGATLAGPLQKWSAGTPVKAGAVLLLPEKDLPSAADTHPAAVLLSLESEQVRTRRTAGTAGRPLAMQWLVGSARTASVALPRETYTELAALADGTAVTLVTEVKPAQVARTWNAIGRVTGSEPGAGAIVLSAHLDHIGNRVAANAPPDADAINNGADDDASGTIAVMELAQVMAAGKRPARTVIFAWFGSEEGGGTGSRHFIETSPIPLDQIVANLQFEMIGRPDAKVAERTLWLTGYERSNLGEELARRGARIVADPHPEQNFFTRSDNIRFARRGIVAHTVSSFGLHTDYHRPSDEIKTIDFAHMTTAIQSMVEPVQWLANSTFRPAWKPGMRP